MLLFLREELIAILMKKQINSKKSIYDTKNYTKLSNNNWQWKSRKIKWSYFKDLEKLMLSSHPPLSSGHNRLLLEDLMLLKPGSMVRALVSTDYHMFKGLGSVSWIKNLTEIFRSEPFQPQQFRDKTYFAMNLIVRSNSSRCDFENGVMLIETVKRICSREYGDEVYMQMSNNCCYLFKFHDLLHHHEDRVNGGVH